MEINGGRFLVTGGAGFIGSHLVDMLLERGANRVVVMDNMKRGRRENLTQALCDSRLELLPADCDLVHLDHVKQATRDVDGVFHMASLCLGYCQEHPREGFETNITGTYNLLDACAENKVGRLVFSSSSSVYGNAVYSPMDEKHPFENRNFYGASKICGEALCRAIFSKNGFPYVSLRYMNIYGPRQDYMGVYVAVIMKIIDRLEQGLPPVVHGDGSQAFDFVYVKDACRANCLAMESGQTDEAYNISSGQQTSVLDMCRLIMKHMGKEDIEILFQPEDASVLVTNRIGSTEKAACEIGFVAATGLEEGLAATIRWKVER